MSLELKKSLSIVRVTMQKDPSALAVADDAGRLPLQIAAKGGCPAEMIELVRKANTEATLETSTFVKMLSEGATEESVVAALGAAKEDAMLQLLPMEIFPRVFPLSGSQGRELKKGDKVCALDVMIILLLRLTIFSL